MRRFKYIQLIEGGQTKEISSTFAEPRPVPKPTCVRSLGGRGGSMKTNFVEGGAIAEPTALLGMTRTFGTLQRNFGSHRSCQGSFAKACGRMSSTIKVLDILLSSRGVDGRGSLPPWQSSLALDAPIKLEEGCGWCPCTLFRSWAKKTCPMS